VGFSKGGFLSLTVFGSPALQPNTALGHWGDPDTNLWVGIWIAPKPAVYSLATSRGLWGWYNAWHHVGWMRYLGIWMGFHLFVASKFQ
jgi:hypothetical protein